MRSSSLRPPRLLGLVEVFAWLVILGLALGALGRLWWIFDLAAHFRAQAGAALALCVATFLLFKKWRLAAGFAVPTLAVLLTLAPVPGGRFGAPADAQRFRLISYNVHTANDRHREVLAYLQRKNPDLILLMEVDDDWLKNLRPLRDRYPFCIEIPSPDNFGIAAYSKLPLEPMGSTEFGGERLPVIDARVTIMGRATRFIGLHPLPPSNEEQSRSRNAQLRHFAEIAAESDLPVIIAGDFNLTPFSPWFSAVLKQSGLRTSGDGFGFTPTWMRAVPFFAIPIDHALISKAFTVVERQIGPSLGSDHNALELTLGIARPP